MQIEVGKQYELEIAHAPLTLGAKRRFPGRVLCVDRVISTFLLADRSPVVFLTNDGELHLFSSEGRSDLGALVEVPSLERTTQFLNVYRTQEYTFVHGYPTVKMAEERARDHRNVVARVQVTFEFRAGDGLA